MADRSLQNAAHPVAAAAGGGALTTRQADVLALVEAYFDLSLELPSSGWLSRRLTISPQRARQHLDVLRRRGWLEHARLARR